MATNFKDIFEYKACKIETDKAKILSVIITELSKFNFEDDYLKEGGLEIISCNEVKFHTCTLENFSDTRSISETNRPNKYGVQAGSKKISEFNSWDYKLSYKKEFQNSDDNHSIENSHHAIGCGTCKQHGKIRCSSCRGAGDVTCSSCSGRGEKQCNSCSGRGETKCWSCSGKGTKETGYGDNKRIERCSSCSARGYKPCSSCRNGYVKCSSCSGRGLNTCYTCHGSGEVTCYQCDGYRTMDHYFVVNAKFINLHQRLFVTYPFPGFDYSKANEAGFIIQNKLFEFREKRFKDGYFEQLKSHSLFRQICAFFDFKDSEKTKLISSRITFFENKYFEVSFAFYGDIYIIYLDQNLSKSYYGGKKPSDQYELDLLKKTIKSVSNNNLDIAKNTLDKLSKYNFIDINEKFIVDAIEDTQKIYKANTEIDYKNYIKAEKVLSSVSSLKKTENDYSKLIAKLNSFYNKNTIIFWLFSLPLLFFSVYIESSSFDSFNFINYGIINLTISIIALISCIVCNRILRNINFARYSVLFLMLIHSYLLYHNILKQKEKIEAEIKPFKDIISSKFNKFGYYVTDVKEIKDDMHLWVKYKNADSIENGYEYKIKVLALLDGTVDFYDSIKDLRNGGYIKSNPNEWLPTVVETPTMTFDTNNNNQVQTNSIDFTIEEAANIYEKYSSALRNEDLESLRIYLSPVLTVWFGESNFDIESVINNHKNYYLSKWTVSKDILIDIAKGIRTNEFRYKKSYTIFSKKNVNDIREFEITGYFILNEDMQIVEMKDESTKRIH
jgi:hypothetical protein